MVYNDKLFPGMSNELLSIEFQTSEALIFSQNWHEAIITGEKYKQYVRSFWVRL